MYNTKQEKMSYLNRQRYMGRFELCVTINTKQETITGTCIFLFYRHRHHLHLHHHLNHHHYHIVVITIISSLFLLLIIFIMKSMMMTLLPSSSSLQLLRKKANGKKQRNIMKINIIISQILRNLPFIHCFTNLFSHKKQFHLNTFATHGVFLLIGCQ